MRVSGIELLRCDLSCREELLMSNETEDASEIDWHRKQVEQNRAALKELEDGNTAGGEVFP